MERRVTVLSLLLAAALTAVASEAPQVVTEHQVIVRTQPVESGDYIDYLEWELTVAERRIEQLEGLRTQKNERIQRAVERNRRTQERLAIAEQEIRDLLAAEPKSLSQLDAEWAAGYLFAGGTNLRAFEQTILPCESGGTASPHTVVGPTSDWGRAQINRKTWKSLFEARMGLAFEEASRVPALNGLMAAHIEDVQGLSAWVCYNRHGGQ